MGIIETVKLQERRQGQLEGRFEGRKEEPVKIAAELKKLRLPVNSILKATGLSPDDIEQLWSVDTAKYRGRHCVAFF